MCLKVLLGAVDFVELNLLIGTVLVTSALLLILALATYGVAGFRSNLVQMFHLGIDDGITDKIDYRMLATTTKHWGCYGASLKELEWVTSVMLECTYCHGGAYDWKFSISGAMDFDSGSGGSYLLGNNKGVMFSVSKSWKVL